MKVVIYARVSTQKQDLERQIEELTRYALSNDFEVVGVYSEKLSGSISERQEFERMIELIETKKINIDKILVWEFTRLGRSTIGTLQNINRIKRAGVSIFTLKEGMNIDPKNPNAMSDFMITILTGIAELEKEQIVYRLQSGREHAKKNGAIFGRQKGTTKAIEETKNFTEIARLLRQKMRVTHIAKITGVARNTIYKIKEHIEQ
jgi:DNA invertase Pin-like site-specific DNA recombinase